MAFQAFILHVVYHNLNMMNVDVVMITRHKATHNYTLYLAISNKANCEALQLQTCVGHEGQLALKPEYLFNGGFLSSEIQPLMYFPQQGLFIQVVRCLQYTVCEE